jgi:hypothetical protein
MRIRIKERGFLGTKRSDHKIDIDDVMIKEDILNPKKSQINILFRGRDSSGIINMNEEEAKRLISTLKPLTDLVKESKRIKA